MAGLFAVLLVLAAMEDLWRLRISNWICAAIIVAAFVAVMQAGPVAQLWQNVAVFAALLAVGTPLFAYGKMGGGDVKLFAATGLWFDLAGAGRMIVAVMIAGGLVAIFVIVLRTMKWSQEWRERIAVLRPKGGIPYGVAIAIGALGNLAVGRG
ncbi:MAG TPA: prepilin peptidase [Sphingomicrobium sp.]|nr:prepilin peptidase [Sphingomicrobium sp.]